MTVTISATPIDHSPARSRPLHHPPRLRTTTNRSPSPSRFHRPTFRPWPPRFITGRLPQGRSPVGRRCPGRPDHLNQNRLAPPPGTHQVWARPSCLTGQGWVRLAGTRATTTVFRSERADPGRTVYTTLEGNFQSSRCSPAGTPPLRRAPCENREILRSTAVGRALPSAAGVQAFGRTYAQVARSGLPDQAGWAYLNDAEGKKGLRRGTGAQPRMHNGGFPLTVREAEHLNWNTRLRIAMGIAYCVEHLGQLNPPVVVSSLHSSSIYLTDDYAAKVSDLVLWSFDEHEAQQFDETPVHSSSPFSDPPCIVYKFGIVLLELISGRRPFSEDDGLLVLWASSYLNGQRPLRDMVDSTLESFNEEDVSALCELIRPCISPNPQERLTMTEVVEGLRRITDVTPDGALPKLSPLWWAELEIISSAESS